MISFNCPQCGEPFEVSDKFKGESFNCTNCQTKITVPSSTQAAAAAQLLSEMIPKPPELVEARPILRNTGQRRHCQYCGALLGQGMTFCPQCGQPIVQSPINIPQQPPPPQVVYIPPPTQIVNVKQVNKSGCGCGTGCGLVVLIVIIILILAAIGSQHP